MSTREGNVVYINDLINEAIQKSKSIMLEKNPNISNIDTLAKQIGVGALIFNYLKSNKNKDMIFDLDETLRFDGETGPYIQYTYVRTKSLLKRAGFELNNKEYKFELLNTKEEAELIKILEKYPDIVKKAADEYEPSILAKYLIDVATYYSKFYNECNVINLDDEDLNEARCILTYATGIDLKNGLSILGIETPDEM